MSKGTRNLVIFFVATFLWTWAFYTPITVGHHNPYEMPWMIFLILGGMGPSLVGVAMVLLTCDKEGRRDYWRRCFSLKQISSFWWGMIFLIFPILCGVSIAIDMVLGGAMPGMDLLKSLIANPAVIPLAVFIRFMSGPWSEEFGWRGYALDRVIKPLGIIPGSIVLGLIWGVWHLPLYFMPATWHGQMGFQFAGFWTFMLENVALSLIMTWVYLNTNLSILSGLLIHFASNFTSQLIAPASNRFEVTRVILMLIIGLTVGVLMERRKQTPIELTQTSLSHP